MENFKILTRFAHDFPMIFIEKYANFLRSIFCTRRWSDTIHSGLSNIFEEVQEEDESFSQICPS